MTREESRLHETWTQAGPYRMFARVSESGSPGRPVVLVHGLGVSSRYFVPTAIRLAGEFPVYAPDLPGFGRSDDPDRMLGTDELADSLALWMDAVGVGRASLVGNSMGCQIAVAFAIRHPARTDRLALVGPTPDPAFRSLPRYAVRLLIDAFRENRPVARMAMIDYARAGPLRFLRTAHRAVHHRLEDRLPRVTAPTLVIRGSRDPLVSRDWAETVCRLLPQGRLCVLPGVAHAANWSDPDRLVAALRPFLRGSSPAMAAGAT